MARDIKKFLPKTFRSDEINNFLDTTTQTLFDKKDAESVSYYIGRKTGGIYSPLTDPYATERSKLREDYQLEPSLVIRNEETNRVDEVLLYEDLLNNLRSAGSYTVDQTRLFVDETETFAPPIDYDMFANYRNYYWYPEGLPSIDVSLSREDIEGKITLDVPIEDGNRLTLTTGVHITLRDNKEYVVNGVGRSIYLTEFNLDKNIPLRVEPVMGLESADILTRFPPEYISMERGAHDQNPWSRNSSWYHRDAIYANPSSRNRRQISRQRQATRPIIQFDRDIELYDYTANNAGTVDLYSESDTFVSVIDRVNVVDGMRVAVKNSPTIKVIRNGSFVDAETISESYKITITNGEDWKSRELMVVSGNWVECQHKGNANQQILFNLYDSKETNTAVPLDHKKYPGSNFKGNEIFSYKVDPDGILDSVLELPIVYKTQGDFSDIVFENDMEGGYRYNSGTVNGYFRQTEYSHVSLDRTKRFSIRQSPYNGEYCVYVENEYMPKLVLIAGTQYVFDFLDVSTTESGWFSRFIPIGIYDANDTIIVTPTHANSSVNRAFVTFTIPTGQDYAEYSYRAFTDEVIECPIYVIPGNTDSITHRNVYVKRRDTNNQLKQFRTVTVSGTTRVDIRYQPDINGVQCYNNGQEVSDYQIVNRTVKFPSTKQGDYVEIYYKTNDTIIQEYSDLIQEIPFSLANNGFNESVGSISHSEIIPHFVTAMEQQSSISGYTLGSNNYRDTPKDRSLGDVILKHKSPLLPLMFINNNQVLDVISAIELARDSYSQYKNNLVLNIESIITNEIINTSNIGTVFDSIMLSMNSGKQKDDSFTTAKMFAAYNKYNEIFIDANGNFSVDVTVDHYDSEIYIYGRGGLWTVGYDYELISSGDKLKVQFYRGHTNKEIVSVRYYTQVEAVFCPPTPAKLGMSKPYIPVMTIVDSYETPYIFITGHDGSKTLAYTSIEDYKNENYDPRDLILLEFERRVYNMMELPLRNLDKTIVPRVELKPGKFRNTEYSREEYHKIEYSQFFKWSSINQIDYTTNNSFVDRDRFTLNYSSMKDVDGEKLPGHWMGIYNYYYDTDSPHLTPWEMLGFESKPSWFDDEYSTDYSSRNLHLWGDLEEGIIRQGYRSNTTGMAYKSRTNPYTRERLSQFIPVDSNGDLLDPVAIGICEEPDYYDAKMGWSFGDNAPVENAWRMMSDHAFSEIIISYILKPSVVCNSAWDTSYAMNFSDSPRRVKDYPIYASNNTVRGITGWIYDYMTYNSFNVSDDLIVPFSNLDICLSHKVGGFVDESELRLYTDGYTQTINSGTNLIPHEDTTVLSYESKDISRQSYSGVIIERVPVNVDFYEFVPGRYYKQGDVIYIDADQVYYKKINTTTYNQWDDSKSYSIGDIVVRGNTLYRCKNTLTTNSDPMISDGWETKQFSPNEWAVLLKPPVASSTLFKVFGYDIKNSYFTVVDFDQYSKSRTVTIKGNKSARLNAPEWNPNTTYDKGSIVLISNSYYKAKSFHVSASNVDFSLWENLRTPPYTNTYDLTYNSGGSDSMNIVEYGTTFNTIEEVANFLSGYGLYLNNSGWKFNHKNENTGILQDWDNSIEQFATWAMNNTSVGDAITISPMNRNGVFASNHGVATVVSNSVSNSFNILDHRAVPIELSQVMVTRKNNEYRIKSEIPIYYMTINTREYEHVLTINNETIFGNTNYNPLLNLRHDRLRMTGSKTRNWKGTLYAPGYIISGNKLLPNFDTSISEIQTIGDMDYISVQEEFNRLKYHNIGYQRRSYLEELGLSDRSQINFYKGFIRLKGTTEAFQRILRAKRIDAKESFDVFEDWAIKLGQFGNVLSNQYIEFAFSPVDINRTPTNILLEYGSISYPHSNSNVYFNQSDISRWIKTPTVLSGNNKLWNTKKAKDITKFKTAGYAQWADSDIKCATLEQLHSTMKDKAITPNNGITAWVGTDYLNHNDWSMYVLGNTDVFASEIYRYGEQSESAVIKAFNVKEDMAYIIKDGLNFYNIHMTHIEDGYYIVLSHDTNERIQLNSDIEARNLVFFEWKPLHIRENHTTRYVSSIERHIQDYNITPVSGMKIYQDAEFYGDNNGWKVLEYSSNQWNVIRQESSSVDMDQFTEILAYDPNSSIISNVFLHDPLQGYFSGSSIDEIDIISDSDPVDYVLPSSKSYSVWSNKTNTLWLDTSKILYVDYNQGDDNYRSSVWGALFPGSEIAVYEWIKSTNKPSDFDGSVYDTEKYIEHEEYDANLGITKTYYYFWVKNHNVVPDNKPRNVSALDISNSMRTPRNNGVPYLNIISNNNIRLYDDTNLLINREFVLQISYDISNDKQPMHSQWKIISEGGKTRDIPEGIVSKLIDSLVGQDSKGNEVPDQSLNEIGRYGIKVTPRQTWFRDVYEARRIFFQRLNASLKSINLRELDIFWKSYYVVNGLPKNVVLSTWYSDTFSPTAIIKHSVDGVNNLKYLNISDNEYVQVTDTDSVGTVYWTIYSYSQRDDSFIKQAQSHSIIQFSDVLVNASITLEDAKNIRTLIDAMFKAFADDFDNTILIGILFAMIRYVQLEQHANDWVFPTTYISMTRNIGSLVNKMLYQGDNESSIRGYVAEAKPYHTKLREIINTYTMDDEHIRLIVTDFDTPQYIMPDNGIRNLNNKQIESHKIVAGQVEYTLDLFHQEKVNVFVNGKILNPSSYEIENYRITFNAPLTLDKNHVYGLTVESNVISDVAIINEWKETRGFKEIMDAPQSEYLDKMRQNDITIHYDRVSYGTTQPIEKLISLRDLAYTNVNPYAILDKYSDVDDVNYISHVDRLAITLIEDMRNVASSSELKTMSVIGNHISFANIPENLTVEYNGRIVDPDHYVVDDNAINFRFKFKSGDMIAVRDKTLYDNFNKKLVSLYGTINAYSGFIPPYKPSGGDISKPLIMTLDSDGNVPTTLIGNQNSIDGTILDNGVVPTPSIPGSGGRPDELNMLKIGESFIMASTSRLPPLVKTGYETYANLKVQETITHKVRSGVTDYTANITVPDRQLKVLVNNDVISLGSNYIRTSNGIRLVSRFPDGASLTITDNISAYSSARHSPIVKVKNTLGGYDGYSIDYEKYDTTPIMNEVFVQDVTGLKLFLRGQEDAGRQILDIDNNSIRVDYDFVTDETYDYYMIKDTEENGDIEIISISKINGVVGEGITRGLFNNGLHGEFEGKSLMIYPLNPGKLDTFLLEEQIIGNTSRNFYPKYGHMVFGYYNG